MQDYVNYVNETGLNPFTGKEASEDVKFMAKHYNAVQAWSTLGAALAGGYMDYKQITGAPTARVPNVADDTPVPKVNSDIDVPDRPKVPKGKTAGGADDVEVPKVAKPNRNVTEPTVKTSYDIPVDENGYTKSNLKLGRQVHKEYKITEVLDDIREKEYILPSRKRIDFIDWENNKIYELKPNNPKQIKLGKKQLQGYIDELEEMTGEKWTGILDTY